ncbi:DUF4365 domain-containing protein [Microbacterium terrisoli]|uniref:DUF4365 domain-containing protein n=1 Tax=Microbacterium terrisoli TaxID=3242192 RepID=UPI002805098F|nr:DUF4365 domain-containing protein [Microbacterium protaetiae]
MTTAATGNPPSRLLTPANHHFTDEARKARYGVAYMQSRCAHAGVDFKEGSVDSDYMAIDGTIEYPRVAARVQIKCTSQFKVEPGDMSLQLKPGWVEKWTESETAVFVLVVKVPKEWSPTGWSMTPYSHVIAPSRSASVSLRRTTRASRSSHPRGPDSMSGARSRL